MVAFAASTLSFERKDKALTVIDLPLCAIRCFTLHAAAGTVRGGHAHKQCSQFLIGIDGLLHIQCHTNSGHDEFILREGDGLLVPPLHWLDLIFVTEGTVMVLCDMPYDEGDYIRSYSDYLAA